MEAYYEYIDFILASSGVGLALCLAAYAFNYIRTLVVVRRLLEKEVESRSPTSLLYMYSLYPPIVYIVYQYLGGGKMIVWGWGGGGGGGRRVGSRSHRGGRPSTTGGVLRTH
jgi:hypothetical protein